MTELQREILHRLIRECGANHIMKELYNWIETNTKTTFIEMYTKLK